ncbi:MAG: MFS transporter [Gammaproteobacteria bacterium]|nr:MFS transporter [Gammaproteobacteria bacterium]
MVLPVLPFVLERALDGVARASVAWHTGLLTGVYMLALFLFAPLRGYVSDRTGRRVVILLGLASFSAAMLWFALAHGLVFVYGARVLAGVFAAAVLPVVFAWVGEAAAPRARAFAWLSAASALGFLFGPALGIGTWLATYRFFPQSTSRRPRGSVSEPGGPSLMWLLALSLLVMFGIGSFEVGLTLQGSRC